MADSMSLENQSIALAGMTHAIVSVEKLATTGYLDTDSLDTAVYSLFQINPVDTESVYRGVEPLQKGLEALTKLFSNHRADDLANIMRYSMSVLHLQKKLSRDPQMLEKIAKGLDTAYQQSQHFSLTHDNVIANLAQLYTDTVSTYHFRIQVMGHHQYLQQQRVANQVRVFLFSAIRSAMLWRQNGGNRWQLLLKRKALSQITEALYDRSKPRF